MGQGNAFAPGEALRDVGILYADGESFRRDMMRQQLLTLGATVISLAESGGEALELFLRARVGLVLVEEKLPDMSGTDLVRQLRATRHYPKALVPMLVIGEASDPSKLRALMEAGANIVVVKPVSPAKLYERMGWALRDKRAFSVKDGRYVLATPVPRAAPISPQFSATHAK